MGKIFWPLSSSLHTAGLALPLYSVLMLQLRPTPVASHPEPPPCVKNIEDGPVGRTGAANSTGKASWDCAVLPVALTGSASERETVQAQLCVCVSGYCHQCAFRTTYFADCNLGSLLFATLLYHICRRQGGTIPSRPAALSSPRTNTATPTRF